MAFSNKISDGQEQNFKNYFAISVYFNCVYSAHNFNEDKEMDLIDSCFASIKPMQDYVDLEETQFFICPKQ